MPLPLGSVGLGCDGAAKPAPREPPTAAAGITERSPATGRSVRARTRTGFVPPTARERVAAIGRLPALSLASPRAFVPTEQFEPVPPPAADEWLAKHREVGQTYDAFLASRPNLPTRDRRVIYLLPVGTFDYARTPSLRTLARYMRAYFSLPVKILPAVSIATVGATSRINEHTRKRQLLSTDILRYLELNAPRDAYSTLALTAVDLYPEDSWNFVFGQASLHQRVGVYSFARHHPSFHGETAVDAAQARKLALRRSLKVMAHEMTHMFGMQHCIFFRCVVNGSNSLGETDHSPAHACPVCLRKLHKALRFDPAARYRELARFYRSVGLDEEAAWVAKRIAYLTEPTE